MVVAPRGSLSRTRGRAIVYILNSSLAWTKSPYPSRDLPLNSTGNPDLHVDPSYIRRTMRSPCMSAPLFGRSCIRHWSACRYWLGLFAAFQRVWWSFQSMDESNPCPTLRPTDPRGTPTSSWIAIDRCWRIVYILSPAIKVNVDMALAYSFGST